MIIKGQFTSVWDGGEVVTESVLDTDTGELSTVSVDANDIGTLEREYFEDKTGEEYEVCPECHDHIMKTVMNPGVGHDLNEEKECSGGCNT